MTPDGELDEEKVKAVERIGASTQFGKGQHSCLGQRLGKMGILDILWDIILGDENHAGYNVEILSGIRDGAGVDNVGVEAAWIERNPGTPFQKGIPVKVRFTNYVKPASIE